MNTIIIKIALLMLLVVSSCSVFGQEDEAEDAGAKVPLKEFIVHFSLGPNWDQAKPPQEQTGFGEHSANMQRLRSAGVIVMGARYAQIGMLIIQSESLENAETIIQNDPAVQHQIFNYSIEPVSIFYPWKTTEPAIE